MTTKEQELVERLMREDQEFLKVKQAHSEYARQLDELERKIERHDKEISSIFQAIRNLMAPPVKPKRKIGFDLKEKQARYGRKMSR